MHLKAKGAFPNNKNLKLTKISLVQYKNVKYQNLCDTKLVLRRKMLIMIVTSFKKERKVSNQLLNLL